MDSMSTPSSALTRYRPLILSITGFAAVYGIYLVYTTTRPSAGAPLHRSGAVHRRPRHARLRSAQQAAAALINREPSLDPTTTYGHFEFPNRNGDRTFMDLRADRLPNLDFFLAEAHSPDAAQLWVDQAQSIYLDRFFAVVLGPAEIAATQDGTRVDRDRMRIWLSSHGIADANIDRSLARFDIAFAQLAHPRLQGEGVAEGMTTANLDNIYGRRGNSVPATEVGMHQRQRETEGQNLKQLLYYIAEEQSKQEGYIHRGVSCNACDTRPLRGTRWRCANCPDFDLCNDCHSVGMHSKTHIFYEIKIPAPFVHPRQAMPVAYPGKPHLMPRSLPAEVCKRLVGETTYEKAEVEGLYDQFTCIASHRWPADPNKLGAAIDRLSFETALFPVTSLNPPRPNLIYDRIFALYDSNADGLVGFEEFIQALACLHNRSKDPNQKLRKVFDGYDVDVDGYVSRKDFLRIFRAFYAIQKELVRDLLLAQQEELTVEGAMETINSSMPLSSAFTGIQIPARSQEAPRGKAPDRFGDMRSAKDPVLDSADDIIDRTRILANSWEAREGFPFDPYTGEPRTQRPWEIQIGDGASREHREVHFAHGGRPIEEARESAIRDRWRRRRFYTDEEEGAQLGSVVSARRSGSDFDIPDPEGDEMTANSLPSPAIRHSLEGSQPASPRSRSSSKVRFQDDVDFDTRSNASTSSRPLNERYGGYEIPQAEKDYGKEILYQVVEDGMNELLDPLFKQKEDLAMQVYATRFERRKWKAEIATYREKSQAWDEFTKSASRAASQDPLLATADAVQRDTITASTEDSKTSDVLDDVSQLVSNHGPGEAISQIEQRISSQSLEELLRTNGHPVTSLPNSNANPDAAATVGLSSGSDRLGHCASTQASQDRDGPASTNSPVSPSTSGPAAEPLATFQIPERWNARYDPTMPQFRPNSEDEPRPLEYDPTQVVQGPAAPFRSSRRRRFVAPDSEYLISLEPEHSSEPSGGDQDGEVVALPPRLEQSPNEATRGSDRDIIERFSSVVLGWNNAVVREKTSVEDKREAKTQSADSPPPGSRLNFLAALDDASREMDVRGGPGRLSFAEFEQCMEHGRKEGLQLAFVEEWLTLGGF
ncbi:Zinc finger ZZ-type protein [Venturia nashicola]|nr:Zinc finger ZZ-type protein [Venturia nashicola]